MALGSVPAAAGFDDAQLAGCGRDRARPQMATEGRALQFVGYEVHQFALLVRRPLRIAVVRHLLGRRSEAGFVAEVARGYASAIVSTHARRAHRSG